MSGLTVFIIVIVAIIITSFFKDREKMIDKQVDSHGGMMVKHHKLIQWLKESGQNIVKVERDYIQTSCIMTATATHFMISEDFGLVNVKWVAKLGVMGNHELSWRFESNVSQEEIIAKIEFDLIQFDNNL